MKLHTLGPETTDSYKAAMYLREMYLDLENAELVLHDSFDEIYRQLDNERGDLFLVPVAYQSANSNGNWADNNLKYWNKLKILNVFKLPLMPLVLVRNPDGEDGKVVLHPATKELMKEYSLNHGRKLHLEFVDSKAEALKKFKSDKYEFSIVTKDVYQSNCADRHDEVLAEYEPNMVWCLYRIGLQEKVV